MATYFLPETEYQRLITVDKGTRLVDLFPNGITFTTRGDDVIEIRQPIIGDDPEAMRRIEEGLKRMNAALLVARGDIRTCGICGLPTITERAETHCSVCHHLLCVTCRAGHEHNHGAPFGAEPSFP